MPALIRAQQLIFFPSRLDEIVKTKEDSEYSRLSHYNKGLKLLKESLESEKERNKGERMIHRTSVIHRFLIQRFEFSLGLLFTCSSGLVLHRHLAGEEG